MVEWGHTLKTNATYLKFKVIEVSCIFYLRNPANKILDEDAKLLETPLQTLSPILPRYSCIFLEEQLGKVEECQCS